MKRGFTLIELSIVLVIIGLIVGGVLVGQDLIKAAQLRSVITDLDKFNTATFAFRNKYSCLPGDCDHATKFWPANANCNTASFLGAIDGSTCNGNGNALVNDNYPAYETGYFWQQLNLAGLIEGGPYSGTHTFTDSVGVFHVIKYTRPTGKLRANAYDINAANPPWQNANQYTLTAIRDDGSAPSAFSPIEAYAIDGKMDDGKPYMGIVQARVLPFPLVDACVTSNDPNTALYSIATNNDKVVCAYLGVKAPF